jgi:mono/diheme cytochrome c family protein
MTTMALRTALSVFLVLMIACQTGTVSSPAARNAEPVDGARLWSRNCSTCHGTLGAGDGPLAAGNGAPSLTGPEAAERLTETVIEAMIRNGRRGMPAFRHLDDAEVQALVAHVRHLMTAADVQPVPPPTSGSGTPSPVDAHVPAPDPVPSRTLQGPP